MATRIIEYGGMVGAAGYENIVPASQKVTSQSAMTATGTSAQSSAVNAATGIVLVQSDEAVYVELGANPTATANSYRVQGGGEQFFHVPPAASWKVAIKL